MDKFVIKRTKPSKAKTPSPKKKSPEKVYGCASIVSTKSTSPTQHKGKQSVRKRYYRWTDHYLIQYNWLIKKSDGKILLQTL